MKANPSSTKKPLILPDGTNVSITQHQAPLIKPIDVSIQDSPVASFTLSCRRHFRGPLGRLPLAINIPIPVLEFVPVSSTAPVTIHQLWACIYALWVTNPKEECLFVAFPPSQVRNHVELCDHIVLSGLGYIRQDLSQPDVDLVLSRFAFWQGAGLPSPEANWVLGSNHQAQAFPFIPTITIDDEVAVAHPTRPPKPEPGSVVYRRYVTSLNEMLTFTIVNPDDPLHFKLFHRWHNDIRVSAGWHEEGDEDHHRKYLVKQAADPHVFSVFAAWDGVIFAYFEFIWTKEDHITPHSGFQGNEWGRGYHVLIGDARYRGLHRYIPWVTSIEHYLFLSDPRTKNMALEPKVGNTIIRNHTTHLGHAYEKDFHFPHKTSALLLMSRERFFQKALL